VDEPLVNYRIHGSQMHLNSAKLIHDYEILAERLSVYRVQLSKKVLMGNVLAMSALLEFSSGNFFKGFSSLNRSFKENWASIFAIFISILWKRTRSKVNFVFWRFKNLRRKQR
jgi:hypothetical protein